MKGARFCGAGGLGRARLLSVFLLTLGAGGTGLATGYFGPADYLSQSQESIQASPEFYWEWEVKRLAGGFHPPEKLRSSAINPVSPQELAGEKARAFLKATGEADLRDFEAASKEGRIKPAEPAKAMEAHRAARDLIAATDAKQTAALPEEFGSEFADYHRGAFAFRLGPPHWAEARKAWEALLERPAGERHYRSVWAAFMLGKTALKSGDYPEAIRRFQQTRALARDGFADSLGMAADSYGWEGRCEWKQNRPEKAAPLFLTQLALGDESAVISLKALIPDRAPVDGMLNYGPEPDERNHWSEEQKLAAEEKARLGLKAAAADPLLRRLVTVHILATATASSWYYSESPERVARRCPRWLAALREAKAGKVEDAEYLGWVAYTAANYEEAAHWLELAKNETPAADWLRAKLQRRAGHLKEAAKSMERAWRAILQPGAYTGWKPAGPGNADVEFSFENNGERLSFPAAASGDFGLLRLARDEFVQALDTFLKGGLWDDAAYIAERVLSTDELKAYVDRQPETPESADGGYLADRLAALRYLLGRRCVREKRYPEAARYLKAPYDKLLESYLRALKDGANEKLPKRKRADAWLTAAWLARHDGMELMGTEVAPDGFESEGMFPPPEIARQRQSGKYPVESSEDGSRTLQSRPMVLPPSREELHRLAKHKISPDIRYHYRIVAAALAQKGARLLADNTEELADVLNTAGLWVKERDEKLGDRYYRLLEKRCPKTEIGKAAIAQHWFVGDEGPWRKKQSAAHLALHKELGLPTPDP